MGVTGLWKLIDQSGKEVLIETLENKVLAIDISIWLHQVIKGFQDRKGSALQNAHVLGLFNRLCKLLFYRIKPVFIFDGAVPILKRETIAKRQQGRTKILKEVERIQELLSEAMKKEKIVHQALGSNDLDSLTSIADEKTKRKGSDDNDGIFRIPDYLSPMKGIDDSNQPGSSSEINTSFSENDTFDDSNLQHYYNLNLQNIDITSAHFKNLPADVRLEILADIKEMRKQNSWGRLHEMPTQSDNFSSFQMKRLLKRRQVQVGLEEAEKELEGKSLTLSELETFLTEQGIVTAEQNANSRVNSDASTRFLLVKDLKKAIEKAALLELKKNEPTNEETTTKENTGFEKKPKGELGKNNTQEVKEIMENDKSSTSFESLSENEGEESDKNDIDLQIAIELSLNKADVYNDNDYASKVNFNKEQKDMFKNATGPVREYLLKYGLIKNFDLSELEESKVVESEDEDFNIKHNKSLMAGIIQEKYQKKSETDLRKSTVKNIIKQSYEMLSKENRSITIMSDDSDNDSDFLEVSESQKSSHNILMHRRNKIEIHLDPTKKMKPEDDLFADIFLNELKKPSIENILDKSNDTNITNSNKISSNTDETNEKQENVAHILEKLQKEALEVQKLSLDDIKVKNSVIEILESQQNIDAESKTDNIVIEIKDSQDNVEFKSIEVHDSQEVQPSENESDTFENDSLKKSLELELPETQESFVLKMEDDESVIEIFDSQNFGSKKEKIMKDVTKSSEIIEILDESIIEKNLIPEKEVISELTEKTNEIIEILDESITPLQKTPSKPKIQNYFETEYIVKKTPSKDNEEKEDEIVSKVTSPYFIKKTPNSSDKKRKLDTQESVKRTSKVSKALFENNEILEKEKELEIKAIKEASEALKSTRSKKELETMVTELDQERNELEVEKNRQDRMCLTITEKMTNDCMDLLKLFGIPYIIAPMEAEAQCAFLEAVELTDGTITDDSDIWLFGGRTVYKNFFDKQKHVLEFKIDQIQRDFSLDRERLIQLAFLVGSDYTIGIKGIGAVTALEILAAFPSTPAVEKETSKIMSLLSSLRKFRDWFINTKTGGCDSIKIKLKNKLKNIEIINGFPSLAVAEAYLYPRVDDSKEPFTWGTPELEAIKKFTRKYFGWNQIKTEETLGPVLRRLEQKKSQTSIKNFFAVKSITYQKDIKLSKRVEKAVKKMSTNYNTEDDEDVSQIKPKKPKRNLKKKSSTETLENEIGMCNKTKPKKSQNRKRKPKTDELVRPDGLSTLIKVFGESPEKKTKLDKKPSIPQTKLVIPQRERDINEMNKRKETASALFKRSRAVAGKKKNLE